MRQPPSDGVFVERGPGESSLGGGYQATDDLRFDRGGRLRPTGRLRGPVLHGLVGPIKIQRGQW